MVLSRTAILVAMLAPGLAYASSAHATFAGTNGSIAYVAEGASGALSIESAFLGAEGALVPDVDELKQTSINRAGDAFDPSLSPDGRELAFTSTRSGRREIYSKALGGVASGAAGGGSPPGGSPPAGLPAGCAAEPCPLTSGPGESYEPAWAPDGKSIVFVSTREGSPQLYRMSASGEGVARLTSDGVVDQQPTWSQTGKIAFVGNATGVAEVYVMNGRGEELHQLTQGAASTSPSWSPDGAELAYMSQTPTGYQVFVSPLAGGEARQLTSAQPESRLAVWSPDGTKLVVTRGRGAVGHAYFEAIDARFGVTVSRAPSLDRGEARSWAPLPPAPPNRAPQPSAGVSAIARPLSGRVEVNPTHPSASATSGLAPGGAAESPAQPTPASLLTQSVEVPVNSTYNATAGVVKLTVAAGASAPSATAILSGGRFRLQQRAPGSVPTIRLLGKPRGCRRGRAHVARPQPAEPRVRGHTRHRFRVVAGDSSAGSPATQWEVRETCRGVLYRVFEHSLWVHDPHRRHPVYVQEGHQYLVRSGR
jgi:hypothetical protein